MRFWPELNALFKEKLGRRVRGATMLQALRVACGLSNQRDRDGDKAAIEFSDEINFLVPVDTGAENAAVKKKRGRPSLSSQNKLPGSCTRLSPNKVCAACKVLQWRCGSSCVFLQGPYFVPPLQIQDLATYLKRKKESGEVIGKRAISLWREKQQLPVLDPEEPQSSTLRSHKDTPREEAEPGAVDKEDSPPASTEGTGSAETGTEQPAHRGRVGQQLKAVKRMHLPKSCLWQVDESLPEEFGNVLAAESLVNHLVLRCFVKEVMEVLTLGEPSGSEEGGGDAGKARPDACSSTRAFRIPTGHGAEPDTSDAATTKDRAEPLTRLEWRERKVSMSLLQPLLSIVLSVLRVSLTTDRAEHEQVIGDPSLLSEERSHAMDLVSVASSGTRLDAIPMRPVAHDGLFTPFLVLRGCVWVLLATADAISAVEGGGYRLSRPERAIRFLMEAGGVLGILPFAAEEEERPARRKRRREAALYMAVIHANPSGDLGESDACSSTDDSECAASSWQASLLDQRLAWILRTTLS
mmetsp:Transcript_32285/g.77072  ORF Transcript_32285/g.77072 Transcript_32285/m.77072 type:complete len:524 (-) Transcript_32285:257-1828(-)